MASNKSPLFSCRKFRQIIGLGITVTFVVDGTDQNDAVTLVMFEVLVKVSQIIKVGKQKSRVGVQDWQVVWFFEIDLNVLRRCVLAQPPSLIDFESSNVNAGGRRQKPFHKSATTTDACYL